MPRLAPSLFWRARREISPMATLLLPACRDLQSAANELRWIREHVRDTSSPIPGGLRLWWLCEKRGKGVPLQYVLGTQPFGDLEIQCRPGVLIPRPETESYTLHLASLLSRDPSPSLSILDLCTGTGCIALLLAHALLNQPTTTNNAAGKRTVTALGIDISPRAIRLARLNHRHNARLGLLPLAQKQQQPPSSSPLATTTTTTPSRSSTITFHQADIFSPTLPELLVLLQKEQPTWDVLVSNPPYVSRRGFARDTARSVRNHEPRAALVPDSPLLPSSDNMPSASWRAAAAGGCRRGEVEEEEEEDVFYARLLEVAALVRPRRVLLEVGGWEQAVRVVRMLSVDGLGGGEYGTVEIWRDEPGGGNGRVERLKVGGRDVVVRGVGMGRSVYLERG